MQLVKNAAWLIYIVDNKTVVFYPLAKIFVKINFHSLF